MSNAGKRASSAAGGASSSFVSVLLVALALGLGLWILVSRGQVTWPPHRLLASLSIVVGCIGLVGPLLLTRSAAAEPGLGTTIWWFGGVLLWLQNLAGALRGDFQIASCPNPMGPQPMGLAVLAALIATWRTHGAGRTSSWPNVVGWILGLFWIGVGLASFLPGGWPASMR
jgi:hypothetical protein